MISNSRETDSMLSETYVQLIQGPAEKTINWDDIRLGIFYTGVTSFCAPFWNGLLFFDNF